MNRLAHVDVALYGTITKHGGVAAIPGLAAGGITAFKLSTYEYDAVRFPRIDHPTMVEAFRAIAATGLPVSVHNEDQELVERLTAAAREAGETHAIMHARTRPPLAETMADGEIFEIGLETGAHVHIAHSSVARGFAMAEAYRGMGGQATGEACVQYLCMTEDDLVRLGGRGKCNPPFRTAAEVEGMWRALEAGTVAYVSTDHAPWPADRKGFADIFACGAGLTGLQSFAPVMATLLLDRGLPLTMMATYCSERTAQHHGLWPRKGAMQPGADADLLVLEPGRFTFDEAEIQGRAGHALVALSRPPPARPCRRHDVARAGGVGRRAGPGTAGDGAVRAPGMSRVLTVAAAQMGPTQRADSRARTLERIIALLEQAAGLGAKLVVFPELAFTTFFPRWQLDAEAVRALAEPAMPNPNVQPLFDRARALAVGFSIGYAEHCADGRLFNSAITVAPDGSTIGHYRKVHLPGTAEPRPGERYQQLEKRYFDYGDLGFRTWRAPASLAGAVLGTMICNDRRWAESWRLLGLGGVELVCCGYNSAAYDPNGGDREDAALRTFHSKLVVQANAYMNATWAVATAKAGVEDGAGLIGGSCIVDPNGLVVAEAATLADEVIVAACDLDACRQGKEKMFDFAAHRRPEWYAAISGQTGAEAPV